MRPTPLYAVALAAGSLALTPSSAQAKDLRNRFGVGFDTQIEGVPTLSLKYTFPASDKAVNMGVQLLGGAKIPAEGSQAIAAGGRFLYTVVAEDQMNLFLGAGALYLKTDTADLSFEGVRAQALLGAEVFLYGLDNLGLTFQAGVNVDLGGATPGVSTTASSLAGMGLHYYF